MPKANPPSENPDQSTSEDDLGFELLGDEFAPPPFSFPSAPEPEKLDQALRDGFITETAKREMETTQDLFRFLPTEDLNALDSIGHPVRDSFLDPFLNCNLHQRNVQLLVQLWQKQAPERNLEQLAQILAMAWYSSGKTFRCLPEHIAPAHWELETLPTYAESMHWGRGFAALTWEENYFKMGEELGLDLIQHPSLALLPEVAASILGTGLFVSGFANTGTLARYFKGDRDIGSNAIGLELNQLAEKLHIHLKAGNARLLSPEEVTELVFEKFSPAEIHGMQYADVVFLLAVLGYAGAFPTATEPKLAQEVYQFESSHTLGLLMEDKRSFWPALARFQTDFNRAHPLKTPLNEQGILDKASYLAISAGGFRLRAGQHMVDFAFESTLPSSPPLTKAFASHSKQEIDDGQWAQQVYQCMPLESPGLFIQQLGRLPSSGGRKLAIALLEYARNEDQMALINRPILEKLKLLLAQSDLLSEVQQAISGAFGKEGTSSNPQKQLDAFLHQQAQPPMRYAVVEKGWGEVLEQYATEALTKEELLELNPDIGDSTLVPGQLLILPERIRRAFWSSPV